MVRIMRKPLLPTPPCGITRTVTVWPGLGFTRAHSCGGTSTSPTNTCAVVSADNVGCPPGVSHGAHSAPCDTTEIDPDRGTPIGGCPPRVSHGARGAPYNWLHRPVV